MSEPSPILAIGSALWDVIAQASARLEPGDDKPGKIERRPGGVALNAAIALAAEGIRPILLSRIGIDPEGTLLIQEISGKGVDCAYLTRTNGPTDVYVAIEAEGALFGAVADCGGLESAAFEVLSPLRNGQIASPERPFRGTAVIDGNLSVAALEAVSRDPAFAEARLFFVPASPGKAERLRGVLTTPGATILLNRKEAELILGQTFPDSRSAAEALRGAGANTIVTDGADPVTLSRGGSTVSMPPPSVDPRQVTGAGDAFLAGFLAAEARGEHDIQCLQSAIDAATRHVTMESA